MRTNTNGLAIILCLNLLTCFTARAGIDSATVNQVEQDKARESALMPHQQQYQSSRTYDLDISRGSDLSVHHES